MIKNYLPYELPLDALSINEPFYIWGASAVSQCFIKRLKQLGKQNLVMGIIERDRFDGMFFGVRLIAPTTSLFLSKAKILIGSYSSYSFVRESLISLGVCDSRIMLKAELMCQPTINLDVSSKAKLLIIGNNFVRDDSINNLGDKLNWYCKTNKKFRIDLIDRIEDVDGAAVDYDDCLVLSLCADDLQSLKRRGYHEVYSADPNFFGTVESSTLSRLALAFTQETDRQSYARTSKENFIRLAKEFKSDTPINLFGTGPSLTSAQGVMPADGVNFICNSAIKDKKLIQRLKPRACFLSDPVFHFSYCSYAVEFRKDLLAFAREYDSFLIMPFEAVPLMLNNFPDLEKHTISITPSARLMIPNESHMSSLRFENVLTSFMLPLASSFSKNLRLTGFDGRDPKDNYFWGHAKNAQYGDLYADAILSHPSFFHDRDYDFYYAKHCHDTRLVIDFVKTQGVSLSYYGETFIPALRELSHQR